MALAPPCQGARTTHKWGLNKEGYWNFKAWVPNHLYFENVLWCPHLELKWVQVFVIDPIRLDNNCKSLVNVWLQGLTKKCKSLDKKCK